MARFHSGLGEHWRLFDMWPNQAWRVLSHNSEEGKKEGKKYSLEIYLGI